MPFVASPRLIALAAAAAALQAGAAFAQSTAPAPAAAASASDGLKLDRVVITGTSTAATLLQRQGWEGMDSVQREGHDVRVFRRATAPAALPPTP